MFERVVVDMLVLVGFIAGIPLLVSAGAGFIVSLLQTITQIQETSVVYVVKLVAGSATLFFCFRGAEERLIAFTREMLTIIAACGALSEV